MNLQKSLDRLIELFGMFRFEVEAHNHTGRFDINSLSEDVLVPVFRDVFACQYLRNLNREQRNYPGLDLGDDQARIAFQITSDPDIEKVKETLEKVVAHNHHLRYDKIYVYVLTQRQKRYSKRPLSEITKGRFDFNPDEQIIDSRDVMAKIRGLDYEIVQRIEQTLEVHFTNSKKYFLPPQRVTKTEKLTLDLVPITFPVDLFIGKVIYDREDIIQKSWEREFKLNHRSSQRRVVHAALEQRGLTFNPAWVVRSDEIITFHNLRDESLALAALVEPTTVDPKPVSGYIRNDDGSLNIDQLNIFKELLRTTLQAQLRHRGIVWQHEERVFIFVPMEKRKVGDKEEKVDVRKEQWSRGRKEGRIVYRKVNWKTDPTKTLLHEHLAFETGFDLYDDRWYMAIKPDMFCSKNGYAKSKFHRNHVSFIKRKSHNIDVLDDLLFITEILHKDQSEALLVQMPGPRIALGELVMLDEAPLISDKDWLQQDEKRKRKAFERPPEMPLFESNFESHETGNDTGA